MKVDELIEMLEIIRHSAEPIQTPDSNCGYSTLVKDVKCDDSFTWVIDEAIKELNELNRVKNELNNELNELDCKDCIHNGEKSVTGHCIKCRDKDMWELKKGGNEE